MVVSELVWVSGAVAIILTLNGLSGLLFRFCLVARVARVERDYSNASAYKKRTVHRTGIATGGEAMKYGIYNLLGAVVSYIVLGLALFGVINL